jgi:hypothetical protein
MVVRAKAFWLYPEDIVLCCGCVGGVCAGTKGRDAVVGVSVLCIFFSLGRSRENPWCCKKFGAGNASVNSIENQSRRPFKFPDKKSEDFETENCLGG